LTRQTAAGAPAGGFGPAQKLSLRQVLEAYTQGSAYAEYAEKTKGRLAPGMLADVVIWDRDLFALPVDRVKDASVVTTISDGKVVYSQTSAAGAARRR
jgi:predicted amidohydrolase YtcJ